MRCLRVRASCWHQSRPESFERIDAEAVGLACLSFRPERWTEPRIYVKYCGSEGSCTSYLGAGATRTEWGIHTFLSGRGGTFGESLPINVRRQLTERATGGSPRVARFGTTALGGDQTVARLLTGIYGAQGETVLGPHPQRSEVLTATAAQST